MPKTKVGKKVVKSKRGRPSERPYDKWFKAKQILLVRGEHFNCETHSMVMQLRAQAKLRNLKIQVRVHGNAITLMKGVKRAKSR